MYTEDNEEFQLIQDFKNKIDKGESPFYDAVEMEIILEELFSRFDKEYLSHAIRLALKYYPNNMIFHLYQAREYILQFELERADEVMQYIEKKFPLTIDFYLEKITLMHLMDAHYNAIPIINKALKLDPNDVELHFLLCMEYAQQNNFEKELEEIKFVINNDDNIEERFSHITSLMVFNKQQKECYKLFNALSEEFPLSPSVWSYVGISCTFLDKTEEAIEAFEFALACDNEYTLAHFMLGQTLFIEKDYETAIEHLSQTLDDEIFNFTAYRYFGDYEFTFQRYEEALKYYQQSLELATTEHALCGIIRTLNALGLPEETETYLEQLSEENMIVPDAFADIFSILIEMKKTEKIPEFIEKILPEYPEASDFFEELFHFILQKQEYEIGIDILATYKEYLDEHGAIGDYYYYCAALYYLLHEIEKGHQFLHNALLFNYDKHSEFLEWDPSFSENETILNLIQKYKI